MNIFTDLISKSKKCFIISLIIIIAGMVLFFFPGINKTVEYTGGTYLSVELGADLTEENYKENLNEIKSILKDNGVKSIGYDAMEGSNTKTAVVIKYKDIRKADMDSVNAEIKTALEEHFGDKNYAVEVTYYKLGKAEAITEPVTILILSACLIAAAFVYIGFRFRWLSACAMVIGLIHDVLLTIAVTTILSFTGLYLYDQNFVIIMVAVAFYSIFNSMMLFDKARNNAKRDSLKDADMFDIAEISVKDDSRRMIITTVCALIFFLIFGIAGISTIGAAAVPFIIGIIACAYGSIFIALPLWAIFNTGLKNTRKKAAELKAKQDLEDEEM